MKSSLVAGSLLGLANLSLAQVARYCSQSDSSLCYSVNVPDASAQSGSGDLFFQITAPDSLEWAAMGSGQQMAGSRMLVIYANSGGDNVTISARRGQGHFMPQHDESAQVELLAGSGISNGMMTANIKCSDCSSWLGDAVDYGSSSSDWIYAMKEGESLASSSNTQSIMQHDSHSSFTLDLAQARGGSSANPFVANAATSGNGGGSGSGTASGAGSQPSGNVGSSGGSSSGGGGMSKIPMLLQAHGVIMGLAFVIIFPAGVFIRAFAPQTSIWAHAGIQAFAWILSIAGMGIGIYIARQLQYLGEGHAIIGLVVVSVTVFQPIGGILQHSHFKKTGTRGIFGWAHRFMGIFIIALGIINGGLGLKLADNSRSGEIAYGVLAGIFGIVMLGAFALSTFRRSGPVVYDKHVGNGHNGVGTEHHNGNGTEAKHS